MGSHEIRFTATILRKQADLPRYIIVKPEHVAGHATAFAGQVTLNGAGPFARNIRPWGKGSDAFFFNLTAQHCKKAGVDTGDECTIAIALVD